MQPVIDDMLERGLKNGIPKDIMQEICDEIITFANYGFNKGHSAAYGLLAWYTAYIKAHYTAEYMASLIDIVGQDTSGRDNLSPLIEHCKKINIKVLPPDIGVSQMKCVGKNRTVTLGFNLIAGVGNSIVPNGNNAEQFLVDNLGLKTNVNLKVSLYTLVNKKKATDKWNLPPCVIHLQICLLIMIAVL